MSEPESCRRRRRRSVRCGPIAAFLRTKGAMPRALGSLKRRNGRGASRRVHQESEKLEIKWTLGSLSCIGCISDRYLRFAFLLSLPCQAPSRAAVCWITSSPSVLCSLSSTSCVIHYHCTKFCSLKLGQIFQMLNCCSLSIWLFPLICWLPISSTNQDKTKYQHFN